MAAARWINIMLFAGPQKRRAAYTHTHTTLLLGRSVLRAAGCVPRPPYVGLRLLWWRNVKFALRSKEGNYF
jgi:hypothetical protein